MGLFLWFTRSSKLIKYILPYSYLFINLYLNFFIVPNTSYQRNEEDLVTQPVHPHDHAHIPHKDGDQVHHVGHPEDI